MFFGEREFTQNFTIDIIMGDETRFRYRFHNFRVPYVFFFYRERALSIGRGSNDIIVKNNIVIITLSS